MKKIIFTILFCSVAGVLTFFIYDSLSHSLKNYSKIDTFGLKSRRVDSSDFQQDFESICSILENECGIIDRDRYEFLKNHFENSLMAASNYGEYARILNTFLGNIEDPSVKVYSDFDASAVPIEAFMDGGRVIISKSCDTGLGEFETGDEILEIDGDNVMEWLSKRTSVFSGERNDKINSSLSSIFKKSEFDGETREFTIRRGDRTYMKTVDISDICLVPDFEIIEDEVPVLKLSDISDSCLDKVAGFLNGFHELNAMILDIRNCRSGSEKNTNALLSMLTGNGFIGDKCLTQNDIPNAIYGGSLIVLIGRNTANSGVKIAEILQGYDKCILVGSTIETKFSENICSLRTDFGTVVNIQTGNPVFYGESYFKVNAGIVPHISFRGTENYSGEDALLRFAIEEFRRVCFDIQLLKRPVTEYGKMVTEDVNSFNG